MLYFHADPKRARAVLFKGADFGGGVARRGERDQFASRMFAAANTIEPRACAAPEFAGPAPVKSLDVGVGGPAGQWNLFERGGMDRAGPEAIKPGISGEPIGAI